VRTVDEIKEAIQQLRRDVEALSDWIVEFLEQDCALADDIAAKIEQSKREIAAGEFTLRRSGSE
jgi:uncharacterized protein YoxC